MGDTYVDTALLAGGALVDGLVPAVARVVRVHEAMREAVGPRWLAIPARDGHRVGRGVGFEGVTGAKTPARHTLT